LVAWEFGEDFEEAVLRGVHEACASE
jgi:hypothetical protein